MIIDVGSAGWELRAPGFRELKRAIDDSGKKYDHLSWQERDEKFEKENRCVITYSRNNYRPSFVIFNEPDWTWFLMKWSS